MWIATSQHCREIDRRATEEFGLPGNVLTERAGLAVFEAIRELLPEGGRITVLCGKGGNGGDGFVAGRVARDHGYHVECLVACEEGELSDAARAQMTVARALGLLPIFFDDARWRRRVDSLGGRDLVVDALLGIAAKCNVKGAVKEAIQAINRAGVPVVSVDVPSGIHADTGEELEESVWALRTVTMGLPKPFLFEGIGLEHSGHWTVAEIGYPGVLTDAPTHARLLDEKWVGQLLPERLKASHKGENGSVLIVAGSRRLRGAAALVARAALRAGAGLVTVASIDVVCDAVAAQLPEALFLPLPEKDGAISPDAVDLLLEAGKKAKSAVFGPGLTHADGVMELLGRVWSQWEKPCVLDADALNAIALGVKGPGVERVYTPHPGEMGRLIQSSVAEVQTDRFQTMRTAIDQVRASVLLKGPYSIVGEPGQPMLVNRTGNAGQATGGMGDVLSGVIATLMAQELPAYYAAACGMYWHGAAADDCAERIGHVGYGASDVADALPGARTRICRPDARSCYGRCDAP